MEDDDIAGVLQELGDLIETFGQWPDLDDAVGQPELLGQRRVFNGIMKLLGS